MQKTNFFSLLGDHQQDLSSPSLPPETNDEDDDMNVSASFGLDSVLHRAEAKAISQSKTENSSPYGSFRPKLHLLKSGFDNKALHSSAKSLTEFKPVKVKQTKIETFEVSPKGSTHRLEKQAPSLPPETNEDDDCLEDKSLTQSQSGSTTPPVKRPALPNLSVEMDVCSLDNDSLSLSQLTSNTGVGSQPDSCDKTASTPQKPEYNSPGAKAATPKSNSIMKFFKPSRPKEENSQNASAANKSVVEISDDGSTGATQSNSTFATQVKGNNLLVQSCVVS